MNVLLFSKFVKKTGVGNHIKQLADSLNVDNKAVVVAEYDELGVNAKFYKSRRVNLNPINIIKNVRAFRKIIKEEKIDVVHCHHRMAAFYIKIYRIFFKIPMVYSLHTMNIPSDWIRRKMTFVGEKAIGVSSEVSQFMIEKLKIDKEKVTTVFNGVDDSLLTPLSEEERKEILNRFDITESKTIIAMHGRIDKMKNHLLTVEAVNLLDEEEKKKIIVVCSGLKEGEYYSKVVTKIKEYNLVDNFRFVGWVDTRSILGISDLLLAPSFKEGFSLSCIEAFLMKVPVLMSKTAGFIDQKYCYPISNSEPMDIVTMLHWVQNNKEEIEKVKEDAYNYAKEQFVIGVMTKKLLEVYESVLKR